MMACAAEEAIQISLYECEGLPKGAKELDQVTTRRWSGQRKRQTLRQTRLFGGDATRDVGPIQSCGVVFSDDLQRTSGLHEPSSLQGPLDVQPPLRRAWHYPAKVFPTALSPTAARRSVNVVLQNAAEDLVGVNLVLRRVRRQRVPKNGAIETRIKACRVRAAPLGLVNLPTQMLMVERHFAVQLPSIVPCEVLWNSVDHKTHLPRSVVTENLFQEHAWRIIVELRVRVRGSKLYQRAFRPKELNGSPLQVLVMALIEAPIFEERDTANVGNQNQLLAFQPFSNPSDVAFNETTNLKQEARSVVVPKLGVPQCVFLVAPVIIERIERDDREAWKKIVTKIAKPLAIAHAKIHDCPLARAFPGHLRRKEKYLYLREFQATILAKRVVVDRTVDASAGREPCLLEWAFR
mmetsp:Transcript_79192/g.220157  ORF Transcript_79192/g.220157 Transcript_79192/m.220157 type:complete len:407 (+) Transcript_79192:55-1275(+)